ncbi:hypothetical protein VPH35_119551 [Triticum aestivum]|nr:uncharacterized protein LOC123146330 [Triticum aestivum]XP_044421913.1 uncharacterized protein LOC123146330 [Triticum aestivum]
MPRRSSSPPSRASGAASARRRQPPPSGPGSASCRHPPPSAASARQSPPSGASGAASARRGHPPPPLPAAQSVPARRRGTGARRGAYRSQPASPASEQPPPSRRPEGVAELRRLGKSYSEAVDSAQLLAPARYNLGPPCPPPHIQILPDDLLVEILMRLPPEPIYLFRASHVCKHWRSLIHDARFLCRFHEFHRGTPPVLGFFSNQPSFPFFVSITNTFAGSAVGKIDHDYLSVLDCRHGRALLKCKCCNELLVLDLVTGDTIWLPYPTQLPKQATYNGAVLCVAGHDNCHSCPVLVVLVFSNKVDFITAGCVYSSETGVWGEITSIHMPDSFVVPLPTVLVGNTLYWLLDNDHIIQFDLDKHRLDLIEEVPHSYCKQVIIMPAEDGLVGFAGVDGSSLHLWSRVGSIDGGVPWTRRIIDFEELLGPETSLCHPLLVGYAEDADVIFICADTSVYMIHLKSMVKIERWNELDIVFPIFPYTRFYSPVKALGAYCLAAEPSSFSAVPSLAYSVSRMPGSRSTLAGERPRRRHALQPAGERRPW